MRAFAPEEESWQPNLSWINDELAVGGSVPLESSGRLAKELGIRAIIDLRGEEIPDKEGLARCGIELLHLPTEDLGPLDVSDIEHGIRFAIGQWEGGRRIFVHCAHGIGRSATLALCLLVQRGHAPLDALRLLKTRRWKIAPSPPQFRCWATWLDGFRFSNEVDWTVPTFEQFRAIAYQPAPVPGATRR